MSGWLDRWRRSKPDEPSGDVPSAAPAARLPAALVWRPRVDVGMLFGLHVLNASATSAARSGNEPALAAALEQTAHGADVASLVPRMPTVVPQLLRALRDPHSSTAELAREIAHDPVLVAAVLKTANSPYFALGKPVASIEQALLVLGHDTLRQLVARVAFKPILNVQSGVLTRAGAPIVWDACERFALAAHVIARTVGATAFEPFLAAVLQDAGAIVALRVLDRHADHAGRMSPAFAQTFAAHVRSLACAIGAQWGFPDEVVRAVADQDPLSPPQNATLLGRLVSTYDALAKGRVLVDAGDITPDALGVDDEALAACFARLAPAASD